jgi:Raf kinase inhibitor-like YbhB/YbcL family protein
MKSSTQRRWLAPLFTAGAMGVLLASCAAPPSRGDNVAQINEAPMPADTANLLQGYVSQTRVSGATVWADRDLDNVLDLGEASDQATSATGLFSLSLSALDEAANYRLISVGGTARSLQATASSVGVMLAPRGAKNITPLTTVVALNNNLAAKISQTLTAGTTQYSVAYDVDIARSSGVPGEALRLAKGIETYMHVLGRSNSDLAVVSSTQGQINALQILANNLNELDTLLPMSGQIFNSTMVAGKIREAALEALNPANGVDSLIPLGAADRISIAAEMEAAALAVMNTITIGTGRRVAEASIINACSSAFAVTTLATNSTLATVASGGNVSSISGKVIQSAVNGATVFLDQDGDRRQDTGEPTATTNADGSYSFTVDTSALGSYEIVSTGGTVVDSNGNTEPAVTMIAPQGASNVSLLTTLVALEPALATQFTAANLQYDADLTDASGVDAQLIRLAKVAETFAQSFATSNSPYFTDTADQLKALARFAIAAEASGSVLTDNATTLSTAATTAIADIESRYSVDVDDTLATSISSAVSSVATAISATAGTITESSIQVAFDSSMDTLQTSVANALASESSAPALTLVKDINFLYTEPSVTLRSNEAVSLSFAGNCSADNSTLASNFPSNTDTVIQLDNGTGTSYADNVTVSNCIITATDSDNNTNSASRVEVGTFKTGLNLTSTAFLENGTIPTAYTYETNTSASQHVSPPLDWRHAPSGTEGFALIVNDPDAPSGSFTHWVAYDNDSSLTSFADNASLINLDNRSLSPRFQGLNDYGAQGYGGPAGSCDSSLASKQHRYVFTLYAVDNRTKLENLGDNATKSALLTAIDGSVLASDNLTGLYCK